MPLSSIGSVSHVLRYDEIQFHMPMTSRRRRSACGFQQLLNPMGVCGAVVTGKGEGTGTCTSAVLEADEEPDKRAMDTGLCSRYMLRQSI